MVLELLIALLKASSKLGLAAQASSGVRVLPDFVCSSYFLKISCNSLLSCIANDPIDERKSIRYHNRSLRFSSMKLGSPACDKDSPNKRGIKSEEVERERLVKRIKGADIGAPAYPCASEDICTCRGGGH